MALEEGPPLLPEAMALAAPSAPAGIRPSGSTAGALLEFRGFAAGQAPLPGVLLLGPGDPAVLAAWLARALAEAPSSAGFPAACLRLAPAPWRVPGGAGEAEQVAYRYRISCSRRAEGRLRLQCWRHYGEAIGWQRRCGPMALERFLAHRLEEPWFGRTQARGSAARA